MRPSADRGNPLFVEVAAHTHGHRASRASHGDAPPFHDGCGQPPPIQGRFACRSVEVRGAPAEAVEVEGGSGSLSQVPGTLIPMDRHEIDRRLLRIAVANHNVIAGDAAVAAGLNLNHLSVRARAGRLVKVHPGVYRLPGARTFEGDVLAAVFSLATGRAAFETAAILLHVGEVRVEQIEVSVLRGKGQPRPFVVHEARELGPQSCATVGVIPVTSIPRTLADLARCWSGDRLGRAMDDALVARRVRLSAIESAALELGARGTPGAALIGRLIEERGPGFVPTESELESRLLREVAIVGGAGRVEVQAPRPGGGRSDLYLPDHGLRLEADGRRWHTRLTAFETDHKHTRAVAAAGQRHAAFTYDDLVHHVDEVRVELRALLRHSALRVAS